MKTYIDELRSIDEVMPGSVVFSDICIRVIMYLQEIAENGGRVRTTSFTVYLKWSSYVFSYSYWYANFSYSDCQLYK